MTVRIALAAALATALLVVCAAPTSAQSEPFRPWADPSLPDVLDMEEADVARFEQILAENPDDMTARYMLMAYHQRMDRAGKREDRTRLVEHVLWLIRYHPESEILRLGVSRLFPGDLTEDEYQSAVSLWDAASKAHPDDATVLSNAASFFAGLDQGVYLHYLEATVAADPNHGGALCTLAHLYAESVFNQTPLAETAEAALETSQNVWILGNAAYVLQSLYNRSLQMSDPKPFAAELAERHFLKAQTIDPNLERESILPQIDIEERRRSWQSLEENRLEQTARADAAVSEIRRLPPDAFPELPDAVAGVLASRGCTVPQPLPEGAPRNVIRGEFYSSGEVGWAALCSVNYSTSLLVFRDDGDTNPESIDTLDDRRRLQFLDDGRVGYSREITTVDRDCIMRHYRSYGGPEPPPIDHHGIDGAFLEKASVVFYYDRGGWLRLQGAD